MRILALALAAFLLPPVHTAVDDVAMIAVEGEGAQYWPRWRGPSGQGLATGSGYVDKWSDTENVKWKTKLDTPGNGSPIVWANRIFLTTASTDGTRRAIAAFDRATGRKLWETYAPDNSTERIHPKNGYASSTPTTDGRLVYAYLGPHLVVAVSGVVGPATLSADLVQPALDLQRGILEVLESVRPEVAIDQPQHRIDRGEIEVMDLTVVLPPSDDERAQCLTSAEHFVVAFRSEEVFVD